MNLRLNFNALGIVIILFVCNFQNGLAYSEISSSTRSLSLVVAALFTISDIPIIQAFPPFFAHRMGPRPPNDGSVEESEEDDDDNESQARVEPQITPLNRDECLAKLLCGMSVPVTGGGSPKNGYYSEYAQIVGKFFDAFPLEEDENNSHSHESIEAYDDYSVEDNRPTRLNSKKKEMEATTKSSTGLQLFDLALIKTAKPTSNLNKNQTEDDERNDRSIKTRVARARKIVQKLGEKLQTVRQCQQISGCPFTFKQLRSKLRSKQSLTSNAGLGIPSINYKPGARPKPLSSKISVGSNPQSDEPNLPFRDPQKGDDELEEFFGPPPVTIHRPAGFGMNQMMGSSHNKRKKPTLSQYQYQAQSQSQNSQNDGNQYEPYNPPVRYPSSALAPQKTGPLFPKKKVGYQLPSFIKKQQSGENDEFDDVNQSSGPVTLIGGEYEQQKQKPHNTQQLFDNQGENANTEKLQEQLTQEDSNNDDSDGDNDEDAEYDDEDEDYEDDDNNNEDSNEEEEEDEEEDQVSQEVSKEEVKDEKKKKSPSKSKKTSSKDVQNEEVTKVKKRKIKGYKKPNFATVDIEEEFELKQPSADDDESDPNNVWSKYTFATTGALLNEPKERNKTKLQEKNDEKLNLSSEKDSDEKVKDKDSDEEEEEEEEEDDEARSEKIQKTSGKLSYHDDEEFETTKDGYFLSSTNPRQKPKQKYRRTSTSNTKSKSGKRNKSTKKEGKKPKEDVKSQEDLREVAPDPKKTTVLTQIGGRPLAPAPENESTLPKKTSPLSRFNFNLIRPYHYQSSSNDRSPATALKTRSSLHQGSIASLPSYTTKPKAQTSSDSNSFNKDTAVPKSESYLPSVSFGASNGGKVGTVEYLGAPSTQTQAGSVGSSMAFPFGGTLSSLKSFFKRPGSSSQAKQDIPGGNHQQTAPHSPFIHRPVGPESNSYKRQSSPKGRDGMKKKSKKSAKGRGKKGSRYSSRD